jgi:hypothetical protein
MRVLAAFAHRNFHPDENLQTVYADMVAEAEQVAIKHQGKVSELGPWRLERPDEVGDDFHFHARLMFAMSVPDEDAHLVRGDE